MRKSRAHTVIVREGLKGTGSVQLHERAQAHEHEQHRGKGETDIGVEGKTTEVSRKKWKKIDEQH